MVSFVTCCRVSVLTAVAYGSLGCSSAGSAFADTQAPADTAVATYIADRLHGRQTASGQVYDKTRLVAAHPSYPLGTVVRVTNQRNGRSVDVEIVDRNAPRRRAGSQTIDLSRAAAERLDFIAEGTARVRLEVVRRGAARPAREPLQ